MGTGRTTHEMNQQRKTQTDDNGLLDPLNSLLPSRPTVKARKPVPKASNAVRCHKGIVMTQTSSNLH